jgi:DNA segregation ATPase FtsK/SpoIIIE-like protein
LRFLYHSLQKEKKGKKKKKKKEKKKENYKRITWLIRGRSHAEWRTQAAAQATIIAISLVL